MYQIHDIAQIYWKHMIIRYLDLVLADLYSTPYNLLLHVHSNIRLRFNYFFLI